MFVDEGFQVGLDAEVVARLVLTPTRAPQQETKQNLQYTVYSTEIVHKCEAQRFSDGRQLSRAGHASIF